MGPCGSKTKVKRPRESPSGGRGSQTKPEPDTNDTLKVKPKKVETTSAGNNIQQSQLQKNEKGELIIQEEKSEKLINTTDPEKPKEPDNNGANQPTVEQLLSKVSMIIEGKTGAPNANNNNPRKSKEEENNEKLDEKKRITEKIKKTVNEIKAQKDNPEELTKLADEIDRVLQENQGPVSIAELKRLYFRLVDSAGTYEKRDSTGSLFLSQPMDLKKKSSNNELKASGNISTNNKFKDVNFMKWKTFEPEGGISEENSKHESEIRENPIFISKLISKRAQDEKDDEKQIRLRREVGSLFEKASDMHNMIQQGLLKPEYVEKELKITKFSEFVFRKLEVISQGDFGKVWRGFDINKRKMITMKEIDLKSLKPDRIPDVLASVVFERDTLTKIKSELLTKYSNLFCDHLGLFYRVSSGGEITSLVAITSGGACTLADLIIARTAFKKSQENLYENGKQKGEIFIYDQQELAPLVISVKTALEILQKLRIYHSDIKPCNIVYNEETHIFQIYNFGVSQTIPEDVNEVELESYGNGGCEKYLSPEKRKYWDACRRGGASLSASENMFNPYKCDLWSFSKILKELTISYDEDDQLFKESLAKCSETGWKERAEAKDVEFFKDLRCDSEFTNFEEKYLKMIQLEKRNNKDWGETLKRFDNSKENPESLENINEELQRELDNNDGGVEGKERLFAEIKYRKAWNLRLKKDYAACIKECEECASLYQKFFDNEGNRDIILDIISIKLVLSDVIAISEKNLEKALIITDETLALYKTHFAEENTIFLGEIYFFKGKQETELKKYLEALNNLYSALKCFEACLGGTMNQNCAFTLQAIAAVLYHLGKHGTAAELLEKVVLIKKIIHMRADHIEVADAMFQLASELINAECYDKAKALLLNVYEIYKAHYEFDMHPKLRAVRERLEKVELLKLVNITAALLLLAALDSDNEEEEGEKRSQSSDHESEEEVADENIEDNAPINDFNANVGMPH